MVRKRPKATCYTKLESDKQCMNSIDCSHNRCKNYACREEEPHTGHAIELMAENLRRHSFVTLTRKEECDRQLQDRMRALAREIPPNYDQGQDHLPSPEEYGPSSNLYHEGQGEQGAGIQDPVRDRQRPTVWHADDMDRGVDDFQHISHDAHPSMGISSGGQGEGRRGGEDGERGQGGGGCIGWGGEDEEGEGGGTWGKRGEARGGGGREGGEYASRAQTVENPLSI